MQRECLRYHLDESSVAAALRAESITEIPMLGRFLAQDPANRPGTVVPPEILEAAGAGDPDR